MKITQLKSKIQLAVVTEANKEYEGSITVDEELMEAAGLNEWEKVEINARDKKIRLKTYVIKGEKGSRCIKANGGLAQFLEPGDVVHILSFTERKSSNLIKPKIVHSYTKEKIIL